MQYFISKFIPNMTLIQSIPQMIFRLTSLTLIPSVMMLVMAIGAPLNSTSIAIAAPFVTSPMNLYQIAQLSDSPGDLERAADKAEEAAENIYGGLDTTKAVVGKTEKRNQIIEEAREHGSDKWRSLAEKARAASRSDESLSPVDELNLKRLLESEPNQ